MKNKADEQSLEKYEYISNVIQDKAREGSELSDDSQSREDHLVVLTDTNKKIKTAKRKKVRNENNL